MAANAGKHFPILVEHTELEDHYKRSSHTQSESQSQVTLQKRKPAEAVLTEVRGQEALDCKELGYMVPWEHQDLVAQEVRVGQEQHHGVHGEQVGPMDLLDPVTRVAHS